MIRFARNACKVRAGERKTRIMRDETLFRQTHDLIPGRAPVFQGILWHNHSWHITDTVNLLTLEKKKQMTREQSARAINHSSRQSAISTVWERALEYSRSLEHQQPSTTIATSLDRALQSCVRLLGRRVLNRRTNSPQSGFGICGWNQANRHVADSLLSLPLSHLSEHKKGCFE